LVDTATDAAADDVAYAEAEDTAPPSPDELLQDALDGAIAEGRAAEALEFFGVLPEEEPAPSLAEATVPAATVAPPLPQVAEAPPVIAADEPQRTSGAGVDSAPTRLLDVAAVTPPELPPA